MPALAGLWCVAALFAVGISGLVFGRSRVATTLVYGASLAATLVALTLALTFLLTNGQASSVTLPLGLPWIGAHFRLDPLAAFFLIVVNLGGAIASLYALGYGRHETSPLRVLPYYPVFLGAMNLVVLADDAFVFLLSWEFMSLVSWAMVVAHHRVPANVRAGYIYLVMASFGTLCLLLAFGVLAGTAGEYSFAAMRAAPLTPALALIAGTLTLIGAGSKAGIVPLHVWLPLAHPAAPSHVSALLSGVMTKVGVYGFIRIVFDLIGEPTPYSGLIVAGIGGITAALGVLYALMQHDIKRLLAYHTVENIGIIFIGLGLALAFRANNIGWAAALALTAALFHVFNHSVFKSLLFFGAGSVLVATGERDMERLGGLIHRMPQTAFAFLIGCMAISALPPLNGFVSEWLTFQAILVSPQLPQWGLKLVIPAVGALLALSAALAAACFVKAFGVMFLGRARTDAAQRASEVDAWQRAAMFVLVAFACSLEFSPALSSTRSHLSRTAGRRYHAPAGVSALALDRSDCEEPQLVQRPADPAVPCRLCHPDGDDHPSVRHARDAAQRDLGLRLSARGTVGAIHQFEFRDADPSRIRRRCSACTNRSTCRRRAPCARAISRSGFSTQPGSPFMARWRAASGAPQAFSIACSSSPFAVI